MPEWIKVLLQLLAQFTGVQGGVDNSIVVYGIAASFYSGLFLFARSNFRDTSSARDHLLMWGFLLGACRELFMIVMAVMLAEGLVSGNGLHHFFPPVEHVLLGLATVTISSSYIGYFTQNATLARRYLQWGWACSALAYLSTFWWWFRYISANPTKHFADVWCDPFFHGNDTLWLIAAALLIYRYSEKAKTRNLVVTALCTMAVGVFLKIPDILLHEAYIEIFAPTGRSLYLFSIMLLGYSYISEQFLERRRNELNLKKFKNIIEAANDAIISIAGNGNIQSWNRGAEHIFGYAGAEVINSNLNILIDKSSPDQPNDYLQKILKGDFGHIAGRTGNVSGVRKDGAIIDLDFVISQLVHNDQPEFFCVVRDITESKKLQDARNKTINLINQLSNRVPGMIYQFLMRPDGSSCFPYSSSAIADIYRVSPEQVKDDATSVFSVLHPDDYDDIVRSIQKSAADLTPWIHEYRVKFNDGTVNWLLGNAMPEKLADGSVLWHGFITNINERRQIQNAILESERRLKSILDTCPTAARITRRGSLDYSYYNKKYLAMTNNDEQTIHDFEPSSYYDPKCFSEIMESLGKGEDIIDKLVELKKPLDPAFGIKWVLASYFNIMYEDQPATIAWFHDITERIRLEKMKSEFISTVSHELRTPLTSISGSLGLIVNEVFGKLPLQAHQLAEVAHRNSIRLTYMINDLLDMDKLVAGKMVFVMQAQSVLPIINRCIEDNSGYQRERRVRLLLQAQPEMRNAKVLCDEQRLLQVLSNLLSNAIKFSPDDGQVLIDCAFSAPGQDHVKISVTDQGPGIAPEFQQRLFQKFSQADSSDVRQKGGTGLGLAISRELVEQMGGAIGFTSEPGQGACFYITFPLVEQNDLFLD